MTTPTPNTPPTPTAAHRDAAAARATALGIVGNARAGAIAAFAADIAAQEAAAADAAAAKAEASAERQRIRSVIEVGRDTGRPRQAARLALLGPLSVDQARSILSSMPPDRDAPAEALTLPPPGAFGTSAARAERTRIGAILGHPEAQTRFAAALSLALEGLDPLTADIAAAVLSGLPVEATPKRIPSIAERAAEMEEIGPGGPAMSRADASRDGWSKAIKAANASIGATPPASPGAAPAASLPGVQP